MFFKVKYANQQQTQNANWMNFVRNDIAEYLTKNEMQPERPFEIFNRNNSNMEHRELQQEITTAIDSGATIYASVLSPSSEEIIAGNLDNEELAKDILKFKADRYMRKVFKNKNGAGNYKYNWAASFQTDTANPHYHIVYWATEKAFINSKQEESYNFKTLIPEEENNFFKSLMSETIWNDNFLKMKAYNSLNEFLSEEQKAIRLKNWNTRETKTALSSLIKRIENDPKLKEVILKGNSLEYGKKNFIPYRQHLKNILGTQINNREIKTASKDIADSIALDQTQKNKINKLWTRHTKNMDKWRKLNTEYFNESQKQREQLKQIWNKYDSGFSKEEKKIFFETYGDTINFYSNCLKTTKYKKQINNFWRQTLKGNIARDRIAKESEKAKVFTEQKTAALQNKFKQISSDHLNQVFNDHIKNQVEKPLQERAAEIKKYYIGNDIKNISFSEEEYLQGKKWDIEKRLCNTALKELEPTIRKTILENEATKLYATDRTAAQELYEEKRQLKKSKLVHEHTATFYKKQTRIEEENFNNLLNEEPLQEIKNLAEKEQHQESEYLNYEKI